MQVIATKTVALCHCLFGMSLMPLEGFAIVAFREIFH